MLQSLLFFADAAGKAACSKHRFFIFDPWWKYLDVNVDAGGYCQVVFNFPYDITYVALAILDMLLRLAGLVAVGFIVYGGIQYITSQGEPDGISRAKNTIINALIGLVIAILAAAIVTFIGSRLG